MPLLKFQPSYYQYAFGVRSNKVPFHWLIPTNFPTLKSEFTKELNNEVERFQFYCADQTKQDPEMRSVCQFENCLTILDMDACLCYRKKNGGVGIAPNLYLSFNHVPFQATTLN